MPDGTDTPAAGTPAAPAPFIASLPETLRSNPAFEGVKDVGDLATRYADTRKPFAEQLPEDIRGEAVFKDVKDLATLAKGYHGAQKLLGVPKDQLLRLPTDPSDAKQWDPLYKAIGRPEKPTDYKVTTPDGKPLDPTFQESLYTVAHENGVSQKALEKLTHWIIERGNGVTKAQSDARDLETKTAVDGLKGKWGGAFDKYVASSQAATTYLAEQAGIDPAAVKAELEKTGLGNSVNLIQMLAKVGETLKEDGKLEGRGGGDSDLKSPAEALQEINSLTSEPTFKAAYFDKRNPGHAAAVQRIYALRQLAHPEQGQAA